MKISVGKTVFIPSGPKGDHLFFVVLGLVDIPHVQKQQFLLVNASTIKLNRRYDDTCILQPGDHPFIEHESFIVYAQARAYTASQLEKMNPTFSHDCSPELLDRIIEGAIKAPRFPKHLRPFIKELQLVLS